MLRKSKLLLAAIGVTLASCLLAVIFTMQLTRASDRIIWQSCQPESVKNDSYGYCLYVGEGGLDWSRFPYTLNRKYYLVISVTPTYGHYKEYSFTSGLEDVDTYVKQSKVEWSAEGLTFIEKSGHRLFVPRKWFSKGR